ncbi:hypothetical protein HN385_05120 [archaeon]|jgi:hypothetical protein|nr:hypothetical protein [archaeon]MBT3465074.1 hypothetical protein [archaeon]MBT6869253.1 hypothetical protein [archaeon]MBT7193651.1 hypothetical protein [archaeon]MBT7380269.1 hypothetical protein [archaeon]
MTWDSFDTFLLACVAIGSCSNESNNGIESKLSETNQQLESVGKQLNNLNESLQQYGVHIQYDDLNNDGNSQEPFIEYRGVRYVPLTGTCLFFIFLTIIYLNVL